MVQQLEQLKTPQGPEIIYPDSDGQPMADNTKQWSWMVKIKENIEWLFRANADVFVAGDLLWYPVEGNNQIRMAPDAMVAFGRPKGDRGSYKQWEEDNIPPQVVFEILSPKNSPEEMDKKFEFYHRYGVEEYYLYDPDQVNLTGWLRREGKLESIDRVWSKTVGTGRSSRSAGRSIRRVYLSSYVLISRPNASPLQWDPTDARAHKRSTGFDHTPIDQMDGWVSPRLKVRFDLTGPELQIFKESGDRFLTSLEMRQKLQELERQSAERELQSAELQRQRAERERQRAERAEAKIKLLEERLKELGIDPEQL